MPFPSYLVGLSWSLDGQRLRFTALGLDKQRPWIWEVSRDGGQPRPLWPGRAGRWTPDGRSYVFTRTDDAEARDDIYAAREPALFRSRPSEPVRLTFGPLDDGDVGASPDGTLLLAWGTVARGELLRFDATRGRFEKYLGSGRRPRGGAGPQGGRRRPPRPVRRRRVLGDGRGPRGGPRRPGPGGPRTSGSESRSRHEPLRRPLQGSGRDGPARLDGRRGLPAFPVVGGLRAGFVLPGRTSENERVLRRFLLKPGVSILYADEPTRHHYAGAYRQLRLQGTPIPTNDLWIAALVLQHNLRLHDRDGHFGHLAQIVRA